MVELNNLPHQDNNNDNNANSIVCSHQDHDGTSPGDDERSPKEHNTKRSSSKKRSGRRRLNKDSAYYLAFHDEDKEATCSPTRRQSSWYGAQSRTKSFSFESIDVGANTIGKPLPREGEVPTERKEEYAEKSVLKSGHPRFFPQEEPTEGWRDHPIFQCSNHVANFGSQYNLACLSLGVQALTVNTLEYGPREIEEPYWAKHLIICFVFVGACMGMIIMGMAGDFIGPRWSMMTTCLLGIIGIAASSLIPAMSNFWENLAICRFVVGFALGGAFPLAATNASKEKNKKININTQTEEKTGNYSDAEEAFNDCAASKRVGWAFFWQSPGALSPYIVGFLLLQLCSTPMAFFRTLLSLGIVTNLYVLFCSTLQTPGKEEASPELTEVDLERLIAMKEKRKLNMRNRSNWIYLIGTGGGWFMFDMIYYGIFLFAPELIMNIFDYTDGGIDDEAFGLDQICRAGTFTSGVGILGGFAAVLSLKYLGAKRLSTCGFIFIGCIFTLLAIARLVPFSPNTQLSLFAILALSLNYGPNIATYVLPTRVFPKCVQSTFHGWSSACGKAGALTGTLLFPVLRDHISISSIMFLCAGASMVGALITELFIPATNSRSIKRRTLQFVPQTGSSNTSSRS